MLGSVLGCAAAAILVGCERAPLPPTTPPPTSPTTPAQATPAPASTVGTPSASTTDPAPSTGAHGAPPARPAAEAESPLNKEPPVPTPTWKAIPGGQPCQFAGVIAEVPAGWTIVPQGNATLLVPAGANQVQLEELHGFIGEPTLKSLDEPALDAYLDNAVMQLLQVPATRIAAPTPATVGALPGRHWAWSARLIDGREAHVKAWGFVGSYAGMLVAIATPEVMRRREADLAAIRDSIHKAGPGTGVSAVRLCAEPEGWVRAAGEKTALTGSNQEVRVRFTADGRFHYHTEGASWGLFHTSTNQKDITGSWSLAGDQLTGISDGGERKTFTLEARVEPGTGVAVIAIDGTEFRSGSGRAW